ncbi:MAG: alanine racemase [Firmicutes bacterium]|nr:alanine racemase [Bacillota bacterium]
MPSLSGTGYSNDSTFQNQYLRPAWAEIDLDNLAYNIKQIRNYIGSRVKMMAVVKCDAYGMGMLGIIGCLMEQGVDMLGVAILEEALLLRKQKIKIPILVFGYTPFQYAGLLVEHEIMQTVYCKEQAAALSRAAKSLKKKACIHLEIDTGMGRLGFQPSDESLQQITEIAKMSYLALEGIYTHCPFTNETGRAGLDFTEKQFRTFCHFINKLQERGIIIPVKHICNSMGILRYKHMHMDMVRAGIILYGSYPHFQSILPLKPVMSLKAQIAFIKKLGPGMNVSYGRQYVTRRDTKIATLPLGYGDGYNRLLSNKGEVLVKGRRAPVIGTICMDQLMIDITDIPGKCTIGEEVVLLGRQGEEEITIEEIAKKICGFINYEYMLLIHRRVPRIYKKGGKVVAIANNFLPLL